MGKYQALGYFLHLLWICNLYAQSLISEYANNIIWLGNGVGLGWVIWK